MTVELDNLEEEGTKETLEEQDNSHTEDDNEESQQASWEANKRHKEQMEWSRKEVERLRSIAIENAVESAKYNANSLISLHSKDPKLANEVAKKFWFEDYKEAEKEIKKMSWDSLSKKEDDEDEDFDTKYAKRRSQERHEDAMKKAEKAINKLDEEYQEKAKMHLEKITKGQQLDTESIEEYIDMVTLYVTKDKVDGKKIEKAKESFHSTTVSKSSKWSSNDDEWEYIAWGKLLSSK